MKYCVVMAGLILLPFFSSAQPWIQEELEVKTKHHLTRVMHSEALFKERWIDLPQPQFWRKIMQLSPDSCMINVARNRQVLDVLPVGLWNSKSASEKSAYKGALRERYGLDSTESLYVTTGKSDFYRFHEVFPTLGLGLKVFEEHLVDPWYAQAILLIESPAQLKKSVSGAYGAFQLMPDVAKRYGLRVNSQVDDREDFAKSAMAASKLLSESCIPSARKILHAQGIKFTEDELGFRLLVMHVYHAGAGNVSAVVQKIPPTSSLKELIQQMWVTTAASFGNNSQNYSQLVLAAQWLLHDYIYSNCESIAPISGK
ncbi:MAG: lytic transglycosylase domain-containing protein [Flavobacteriia bacterium]|nr:lytic transglycosylase domain-containing protein [Flavobacteriia bacterium]